MNLTTQDAAEASRARFDQLHGKQFDRRSFINGFFEGSMWMYGRMSCAQGDPPVIVLLGRDPTQAVIKWQGCAIVPGCYTLRSSAIRGAVRALRRIGYKGDYEISII